MKTQRFEKTEGRINIEYDFTGSKVRAFTQAADRPKRSTAHKPEIIKKNTYKSPKPKYIFNIETAKRLTMAKNFCFHRKTYIKHYFHID